MAEIIELQKYRAGVALIAIGTMQKGFAYTRADISSMRKGIVAFRSSGGKILQKIFRIFSDARKAGMRMDKPILDVCCGSKMFWFEKENPNVEFCDIRKLERTEYYPGRYIEVNPDTVCDFTNLPFKDNSFYLIVFDPPHLEYVGDTSIMALKYGRLKGDWRAMLSKGFDECLRVLKPNGVLVFKWSEIQIPLSEILPLFSLKPLFGNKCRKRGNKTHWLCFMKEV